MQESNKNLKNSLIIQSFAPLFLLLTLKNIDIPLFFNLIKKFTSSLPSQGFSIIASALHHQEFGHFFISTLGIVWFVAALIVGLGFNGMQKSGFISRGETILICNESPDNGATFLVTYILPLLTDDVESLRELIVFLAILIMIILLLSHSNTFYQNPVLTVMKYHTFTFKFINPDKDIDHPERQYIGITHGNGVSEEATIIRKYISDGVFVIYNK